MSAITEVTKQKRLKKEELKKDLILLFRTNQMQITFESSEINYEQPIGQIIRQAREMQGLTCKELSELSDISKDQICNIESGRTKNPSLYTLTQIIQALENVKDIWKGNEIDYEQPIGQIIKQARKMQGLTCKELSELSNISENQIYRIESGRTKQLHLDIIIRLTQALKLDREKLISKGNEINYDQPIGQIIKQAREMQALTRKELSELIDVSKEQIYNIESGKTKQPQLDTRRRLFQALKLDREKLISKGNEINYDLPLGQIVKRLMEMKGLTCRELSELSGISETEIYRIESGKRKYSRLYILAQIIQALKNVKDISKTSKINYDQPLGQIIRQAREMKGLTCRALSELSDISETQIYNIESGITKQPYLDTIIRLTKALNLDSEKLISKCNEINYDLQVGSIIRQAREMQGLTCKKLSEISEVSTAQIYSIESGKTKKPNLDTIIRLTQALNLDVEKLTSKGNEINYDLQVGQIIRQAREIQGITCEKLSEISKISIAQIYDIELGKINPIPLDTLTQLTQALRLDSEKLILKNDKIQVGQIIRQARDKQGLTCKKLSEISEISMVQIFSIESGRTRKPKLDTIIKLTRALNLELDLVLYVLNTKY